MDRPLPPRLNPPFPRRLNPFLPDEGPEGEPNSALKHPVVMRICDDPPARRLKIGDAFRYRWPSQGCSGFGVVLEDYMVLLDCPEKMQYHKVYEVYVRDMGIIIEGEPVTSKEQ